MKKIYIFSAAFAASAIALADVTQTAQVVAVASPDAIAALGSQALAVGGFGAAGPVMAGLIDTFIGFVPAPAKPWIPVACGLALSMLNAKASGQSYAAGILPGLAMAGMAARHHDNALAPKV